MPQHTRLILSAPVEKMSGEPGYCVCSSRALLFYVKEDEKWTSEKTTAIQ